MSVRSQFAGVCLINMEHEIDTVLGILKVDRVIKLRYRRLAAILTRDQRQPSLKWFVDFGNR